MKKKTIFFLDSFTLKYTIDFVDNRKIMFLDCYNYRNPISKYLLEYLFAYMIIRKDIDLYVLNTDGLSIDNLNINGYKGSDLNYYIFKECGTFYELNDTIEKIKVRRI